MMEYSAVAQLNTSDCTQLSIWISRSSNTWNYGSHSFQEFPWKLQGRSPCNFPIIRSLWMTQVSRSSPENSRLEACYFPITQINCFCLSPIQQFCLVCFCWCPILQFCWVCFCWWQIQQFWLGFLLLPNPAVFHRSEAPALYILTFDLYISVSSW